MRSDFIVFHSVEKNRSKPRKSKCSDCFQKHALEKLFDSDMAKQPRVWCYRATGEWPLGNGDLSVKKWCESPTPFPLRFLLNGSTTFKKGGKKPRPSEKLLLLRKQRARQQEPVDLRAFISFWASSSSPSWDIFLRVQPEHQLKR